MADEPWRVPLADVLVDDELLEASREAVESGWWSMGPRVAEFERAFAELIGVEHAFAVANGTAALHIALLAAGIGPGDEVVLPSLNFVAAANTVLHVGADPVFCDIVGPADLNLDPEDLERAVGPSTRAIVVLHYGGFACAMEHVLAIARRHDLIVIEDAAHAPGATCVAGRCGAIGAAGCFSFFSNKNLPVGEGGAIVTSDADIAERIRLLRSHGMTSLTWDRHRGHATSYDVVRPGFNYRMDEIRAALALVQLGRLRAGNSSRAELAARYREAIDGTHGIVMPFAGVDAQASSAHHLAVAILPPGVPRDQVRAALQEQRIQTSVHYPPIHRFSAYRERSARPLPNTEDVAERLVTLPLFPHMTEDQLDLVVRSLLGAVVELARF
jgi:dTDP-4-amino-4,6-dideoxygalactose transaminase